MPWRRRAELVVARVATAGESRLAPVVVVMAALLLWWVEAIAMPLVPGRDFGTYVGTYVELFQRHPIDLGYVLGRTPVAPLVVGALLDPFGGVLAEPGASALFAASVLMWFLAARTFGGVAAILTAAVLLAYPGYAIMFHELASDAVFAAAFAGWSLLLVRALWHPSTLGFGFVGLGVGLLVLVRPGNQALLLLAVLPLALGIPWRSRLAGAAAMLMTALVVLGAWTAHNGLRFGDYTVARGGNSRLPFERVFLTERIVRADNGAASRRLAAAVQRDLLPVEPYHSYGIGLQDLFTDPSPLSGVLTTTWNQLHDAVFRAAPASAASSSSASPATPSGAEQSSADTIVVNGRQLPRPTEGERIPAPHEGGPTTPGGSIYTVWTSPSEHHLVFRHPGDRARYEALHRRMAALQAGLPDRQGNATITLRINQLSRWFLPPVLWIALGLVALVVRRPANVLPLVAPSLAAFIVIALNALAIAGVPHYAVAVAPAFVLLGASALFGPRANSLVGA